MPMTFVTAVTHSCDWAEGGHASWKTIFCILRYGQQKMNDWRSA
jgi:hypothetical protein